MTDAEPSGPTEVFFVSMLSTSGLKRTQRDPRIGKQYQIKDDYLTLDRIPGPDLSCASTNGRIPN